MASIDVIKAVAVTAELCGRTFSEAAAAVFVEDLAGFDDAAVINALARCRKEVRGFLTIADVISRIDDGRPGPEEAWAMMPMEDGKSVVWSDEMAAAFGVALPLIEEGETVPARMAFKETYTRLVAEARDKRSPVRWTPSLGTHEPDRRAVLMDAVHKGRMKLEHAQEHCPMLEAPTDQKMLEMASQSIQIPVDMFKGAI